MSRPRHAEAGSAPTWFARFTSFGAERQGGGDGFASALPGAACRYLGCMIEAFGDSTRGGDWAAVRLLVDGDRIVEADAPGLERVARRADAARGGGRRRRDARGRRARERARPGLPRRAGCPGRTAVAMSGGVDSAVALLRARPNAVGVTLRLWLDPDGPDAERACCSPEAVIAARETCHRLGLPHVTLDLREEFRRAVVDAVRPRLRARRDAEPVHPLQRRLPLRRAARVRAARGLRPPRDRPLRADRRASRPAAPRTAPPTRRRTRATCSPASTRSKLERVWFPLGEQDKDGDARRGRARRARGRAPRREPGGVLPRRRRLPQLPRRGTGSRPRAARSSTSTARRSARTTASGGSRPASARASASSRGEAALRARRRRRARTPSSSARASRSRARRVDAAGRLYADVERADAKLRYRSPAVARRRRGDGGRLRARARRAGVRRRARPGGRSLRGRRRRRLRPSSSGRAD